MTLTLILLTLGVTAAVRWLFGDRTETDPEES